jgi:chromate transporter
LSDEQTTAHRDRPLSLFVRFLNFGALAWGGPAAQIAMISRECVDEEHWVSRETFTKTLAVYQVLPGPEAHELCVYFGRLRGGKLGGLVAGLGFMLPGFLLMLGLSMLYVESDLASRLDELFYGLRAAVGALVAIAVVRLGRRFVTGVPLAVLAVVSLALTLSQSVGFALVLAGAGGVHWLWHERAAALHSAPSINPLFGAVVLAAISVPTTVTIFAEGLKAGLLTFGGAYTVIPFLNESSVDVHGWLTQDEFLDGIALGGVLPAPLIIFSTFVGYLAGGLAGAFAMTVGIFLPAFVFPIYLHRVLVAISENARVRPFLLGVAAGVVGLLAAIAIEILRHGIVDVPSGFLAAVAFAVLYRFHGKLTVLYVVLGCGAVGALLQLTGL